MLKGKNNQQKNKPINDPLYAQMTVPDIFYKRDSDNAKQQELLNVIEGLRKEVIAQRDVATTELLSRRTVPVVVNHPKIAQMIAEVEHLLANDISVNTIPKTEPLLDDDQQYSSDENISQTPSKNISIILQ